MYLAKAFVEPPTLFEQTHYFKPVFGKSSRKNVDVGVLTEVLSRGADPERPGG